MTAVELVAYPISGAGSPEEVLRKLAARARRDRLAPPAALAGEWFGGSAVLAPSVRVDPVPPTRAFAVPDRVPSPSRRSTVPAGAVGGGWFGYLGYGLTDPGRWVRERALPDAAWGWCDHVLRQDRDGTWWFEALLADGDARPDALIEDFTALLAAPERPPRPWRAGRPLVPAAQRHTKAVRRCVEAIEAGEVFQANVCSTFEIGFEGDPLEVFATGSERLHPARAAYLGGDWGAVVSLSPELFLARHPAADRDSGGLVTSAPIKGTLPRRSAADDGNAESLRRSVKDVAENVMIVDLVRNDLGRVCEPGSITVPSLLDVQPHPGVWHLVSRVRGQLRPDAGDAELLGAAFPPGSVTGTPKVRALELISELEAAPREVYCGAVGLASPAAGLELNVGIRTLEHCPASTGAGLLRLGVGGGITADSDPDREWQECLTKATPLLDLLGAPRA